MDNQNQIQQILKKVKQNKKYSSISDDIILQEIQTYLKSNSKISQVTKQDIKEIRAKLHRLYSTYQNKKKKKITEILDELKQNSSDINTLNKLLSLTLSTKERLNNYPLIYKEIFKITKKPKIIIDLGCGLNPFSIPFMNLNHLVYNSYDINTEDIKFLNKYFKIMQSQGIQGKANILDIRNINKLKKLPSSDLVLILKVADLLTTKETEEIIKTLLPKTQHIIASFATKTITRKSMTKPKRRWFEMMLQRNNLNFKTITTDNEVFYVVIRKY